MLAQAGKAIVNQGTDIARTIAAKSTQSASAQKIMGGGFSFLAGHQILTGAAMGGIGGLLAGAGDDRPIGGMISGALVGGALGAGGIMLHGAGSKGRRYGPSFGGGVDKTRDKLDAKAGRLVSSFYQPSRPDDIVYSTQNIRRAKDSRVFNHGRLVDPFTSNRSQQNINDSRLRSNLAPRKDFGNNFRSREERLFTNPRGEVFDNVNKRRGTGANSLGLQGTSNIGGLALSRRAADPKVIHSQTHSDLHRFPNTARNRGAKEPLHNFRSKKSYDALRFNKDFRGKAGPGYIDPTKNMIPIDKRNYEDLSFFHLPQPRTKKPVQVPKNVLFAAAPPIQSPGLGGGSLRLHGTSKREGLQLNRAAGISQSTMHNNGRQNLWTGSNKSQTSRVKNKLKQPRANRNIQQRELGALPVGALLSLAAGGMAGGLYGAATHSRDATTKHLKNRFNAHYGNAVFSMNYGATFSGMGNGTVRGY